jgi:hypothetical protein
MSFARSIWCERNICISLLDFSRFSIVWKCFCTFICFVMHIIVETFYITVCTPVHDLKCDSEFVIFERLLSFLWSDAYHRILYMLKVLTIELNIIYFLFTDPTLDMYTKGLFTKDVLQHLYGEVWPPTPR